MDDSKWFVVCIISIFLLSVIGYTVQSWKEVRLEEIKKVTETKREEIPSL